MPSIADVRDALAGAITTGCGLRATPMPRDVLPAPCAVVFRREMDPRLVFSQSKAAYPFGVRVFVSRNDERAAQKTLDELTELSGSGSLVAAVQNGDNWSVTVDYAQVTLIGELQEVSVAESMYLAVDFEVEVAF